jgi:MFS family permease
MTTSTRPFERQEAPDGGAKAIVVRISAPTSIRQRRMRTPAARARHGSWLAGVPQVVVVLGAIALFTDMSSEMIFPLRLIFFVQVLGTPLAIAGLIEGIAEGATSILKIIAGRWADRDYSRRGLIIAGYSVSNLAKPLLALVTRWPMALGLFLVDRSGKAVRGSPRDAMIAEAVPFERRGQAFGFHRGADTVGAALGPLLALAVLALAHNNVRAVFAWTLVPGLLAIGVAVHFLRDPGRHPATPPRPRAMAGRALVIRAYVRQWSATLCRNRRRPRRSSSPPQGERARDGSQSRQGLGVRFWLFAAIATCFALGNSSDAFLFLRTEGLESSLLLVPVAYFGFNMLYALLATPFGSLSDRYGRLPMLAGGYATFAVVYFGWAQAHAAWNVWALFALYSVYYAATEGVGKALVADLVPSERKGTALGWFNGLTGLAALPANAAAAWLWTRFGASSTFALGACLGAASLCLLIAWWPWLRARPASWPGVATRVVQ